MNILLAVAVLSLTPAPEPPAWEPTTEQTMEWKRYTEEMDTLLRGLSARLGAKDPRPPLARPIAPPTRRQWRDLCDWVEFLDALQDRQLPFDQEQREIERWLRARGVKP